MATDKTTSHPMRRLLSNRRGLLAATGALLGAGLARLTRPEPAEATHDATNILHVGRNDNFSSTTTTFKMLDTVNAPAITVMRTTGPGEKRSTLRESSRDALVAVAHDAGAAGVHGFHQNLGAGVLGISQGSTGVQGHSLSGFGVHGTSDNYAAVGGVSANVYGVWGKSTAGVGVFAESQSNAGVFGVSTSNAAVYGTSPYTGVYGTSANIGVWGVASGGGTAVFGQKSGAGGWAGQFAGNVYISGSLTVASGAKSAAVKRRDGSLARVYCQESPEPWFEDFGTATLQNGQASVPLDPEFDEVVKGDDYRVFLTEIGDCGGLFVSRKGPHRFEVKSRAGAAANGTFDYRVVARRAEAVGGRLERIQAPKIERVLTDDQLPKPPTTTPEPTTSPGRAR